MSQRRSITRGFAGFLAVFSVVALLVPAGASAHRGPRTLRGWGSGYTALTLDSGTAGVLTNGLGLSVAPIAPATQSGLTFNFPIDGSATATMHTGLIRHSGGISLSGGGTTVDLTNFVIDPANASLTAKVSVIAGGMTTFLGRVGIVSLDTTRTPITAYLTPTALRALGGAFGVDLGSMPLILGTATVNFR
ncbi:MAG TPA: hypothetical protein VFN36_04935 [Solirubrobacteraceae bacterium]|nr:hypothetical protein [Solirubrobacteraceae bacterium]